MPAQAHPKISAIVVNPELNDRGMPTQTMTFPDYLDVIEVSSGEEAISICNERNNIGLVIIPTELSGINGFDTVATIRKMHPDITLVMVVSKITISAFRLANQVGCSEILSQPVSDNELKALCRKYLFKESEMVNW